LIAAILPEAKRALNTAVKFEGKISADSGKVDACVPNSIVWGLSLVGAALVGFTVPMLVRSRVLQGAFACAQEGVSIFGSKCLSSCKGFVSNLARLPSSSGKKKEVVTYSSVHKSAAAPTGGAVPKVPRTFSLLKHPNTLVKAVQLTLAN
jgi:hypothetical protein